MNGLYSDSISDSLGQALLSLGKITKDDLRQAVDLQKKAKIPFQLALLKIGALSEDSLLEELKVQYDLPIISEDELPEGEQQFLELNAELAETWPNITEKQDALPDAEDWADVKGKLEHLER